MDTFAGEEGNGTTMSEASALDLLKDDHEHIKELLDELDSMTAEEADIQEGLFNQLAQLIQAHTEAEEKVFYPALKPVTTVAADVDEAFKDHKEWLRLVAAISKLQPGKDAFRARLALLHKKVDEHVAMEESELFPAAESALGEQGLHNLGAQIQEIENAVTHPTGTPKQSQRRARAARAAGQSKTPARKRTRKPARKA